MFDALIAELKRSPWRGGAPPGLAFTSAPGRGGHHAERILQGFTGILQVDGYAGYNRLIAPDRVCPDIRLAYCWAHARRKWSWPEYHATIIATFNQKAPQHAEQTLDNIARALALELILIPGRSFQRSMRYAKIRCVFSSANRAEPFESSTATFLGTAGRMLPVVPTVDGPVGEGLPNVIVPNIELLQSHRIVNRHASVPRAAAI